MSVAMKAQKTRKKLDPNVPNVLPIQCLCCESEKGFKIVDITKEIPFRDDSLEVNYDVMECSKCGHQFLSEAQVEAQLKKTVEAYQLRQGLLTAREIVEKRNKLGYTSQQKLVDAAGGTIPIATLKRIEAGQKVQDKTTDLAIRSILEKLEKKQKVESLQKFYDKPLRVLSPIEETKSQKSEWDWDWKSIGIAVSISAAVTGSFAQAKRQAFNKEVPYSNPTKQVISC